MFTSILSTCRPASFAHTIRTFQVRGDEGKHETLFHHHRATLAGKPVAEARQFDTGKVGVVFMPLATQIESVFRTHGQWEAHHFEVVTPWTSKLGPVAAILSRVQAVEAIYVSGSDGDQHIWTVIPELAEATLRAVFGRELELHECLGKQLSTVEFHVLRREHVDQFGAEFREIFKREPGRLPSGSRP